MAKLIKKSKHKTKKCKYFFKKDKNICINVIYFFTKLRYRLVFFYGGFYLAYQRGQGFTWF